MEYGIDLLSMSPDEISGVMIELGEPRFRATQLFEWLHSKRAESFDEMTNMPKNLRDKLGERCGITVLEVKDKQVSSDGTVKYLFALADDNCVETVVMRYSHGVSVCLSTQAGCGMGCVFCASAEGGKIRDLAASEMLAQLYGVCREENIRASNVVLMGIGEPLDNFDNTMRFCDILTHEKGYDIAGRAITISTCGIVPRIYELADQKRQLTLSVSLHAADDAARSAIMPVNRKYPLKELMAACRYYFEKTGRRITFEYAVIHGTNDFELDAAKLARLIAGTGAHVNLIPVNPVRGREFSASRGDAAAFAELLAKHSINATVRRTLGADIDAACGQLRKRSADKTQ